MKGLVHIYCGDGKGKTTAAVGLSVRAAGSGIPVVIVRFIKTDRSGELPVLENIPGIFLIPTARNFKFSFQMNEKEKIDAAVLCTKMMEEAFEKAEQNAESGACLLVMDEVLDAVNCGFIREERLIDFLRNRPGGLEVVMTGRDPSPKLSACADYISEVKKIRHPYDDGTAARKGIEF